MRAALVAFLLTSATLAGLPPGAFWLLGGTSGPIGPDLSGLSVTDGLVAWYRPAWDESSAEYLGNYAAATTTAAWAISTTGGWSTAGSGQIIAFPPEVNEYFAAGSTGYTIVVVNKLTPASTGNRLLLEFDGSAPSEGILFWWSSISAPALLYGVHYDGLGGYRGVQAQNAHNPTGQYNTTSFQYAGPPVASSRFTIYVNGIESRNGDYQSGTNLVLSTGVNPQVGRSSENFRGSILHYLIYNRPLTSNEHVTVNAELNPDA